MMNKGGICFNRRRIFVFHGVDTPNLDEYDQTYLVFTWNANHVHRHLLLSGTRLLVGRPRPYLGPVHSLSAGIHTVTDSHSTYQYCTVPT